MSDEKQVEVPNVTGNAVSGIDGETLTPRPNREAPAHNPMTADQIGAFGEGQNESAADYDPADHTVQEVLDHLDGKDADYQNTVLDKERSGQARKGIVGDTAPDQPTVKEGEDTSAQEGPTP